MMKTQLSTFALLFGLSSFTWAQGIITNNSDLRNDLNWLNQQGVIQISTSTWPLSSEEIDRAVSQAKISNPTQQKVINAVLSTLQADSHPVKVGLSVQSERDYLPQSFADQQTAKAKANLELNAGSEVWDAKLRVNVENNQIIDNQHKVNVEGSYLAGKAWNQWLIAGQIPTWWGPAHDNSLIRGDASRPVYGLTLQRANQNAFESKWLSWIGPWQYQLFAGQLDHYTAVPHAQLLGMRFTASPLPYLELGASRSIQIGGKDQPSSLKAYWNALIGKDNNSDNDVSGCAITQTCVGTVDSPANQLAGIDARLNLKPLLNVPISLYGQIIGEDEAGGLPSRNLYLAGMDFSSTYRSMPYQLYAEWSNTKTNGEVLAYTYYHFQYKDGYYQHGYPLGAAIGGDSEMYSVGGNIRIDSMNRLSGRILSAKVNQSSMAINYAYPQMDNIKGVDLTWTHYLQPDLPLSLKGWISDSDLYQGDRGIALSIEVPLDSKIFNKFW